MVAADAVVDPDPLAGADPVRIAANGMDATTQLLEAGLSQKAGPVTDALALAGLAEARGGLLAWHADPEGPDAPAARSRMALIGAHSVSPRLVSSYSTRGGTSA